MILLIVLNLLKRLVAVVAAAVLAIVIARLVFRLPSTAGRVDSVALSPSVTGPLAERLSRGSAEHAGLAGIAALESGADAFAARMMLADAAVSSIDVRYYIWRGDLTGYLLLDALQRAADRGVRVRLLVDDNGTRGLDAELAALDANANAEVRLYNPFNMRRLKLLAYGFDFFRLNRRMHNKSFTVDGHATILGGRNVADEYFGTGPAALFMDLDVLAVGELVSQVAADFDRYWAARSVYPVDLLINKARTPDPIGEGLARFSDDPQRVEYRQILEGSSIVKAVLAGDLPLEWTTAVLVSDDPAKGEGAVPHEALLAARLTQAVGEIDGSFDGVAAYFVPGKGGVDTFAGLAARGVQVRMLTNSLDGTDSFPVHAGYGRRRVDMLRAGVQLFELKPQWVTDAAPRGRVGAFGSSRTSLHAKTFAVDGRRIFIGSFNFDPRSTTLNTEMGLLITSPSLALAVQAAFDRGLDGMAWRVELQGGDLVWIDAADGTRTSDEPGSTVLKRFALAVIRWLPVEWLL